MTFTISTGDGTTEKIKTFTDGLAKNTLTHYYESAGVYDVTIEANNDVEATPKNVKCTVYVEKPIANLTFVIPPPRIKSGSQHIYIAIGERISAEGSITRGTSVSCDFDFGEEVRTGEVDSFSKTYTYREPGNYTVSLNCTNRVSSMYKTYFPRIIIQKDEPITDLQVVVAATAKGLYSVISLLMSAGTAFVCDWNLGDNTTFQTDVSDMGNDVLHQYAVEGAYNVSVRCKNRHGLEVAQSVAWVQLPIANLTCDSLQRYIVVSEKASFNISVQSGYRVTVVAKFESDQRQDVSLQESFLNWKSFLLYHTFVADGSYVVTVKASNLLSNLTTKCTPVVVVQNPLLNITLTSDKKVIKVSEFVTFGLKISVLNNFLPTDASCSWNFGDNSPTQDRPLIFKHGENIILHRYLSQGKFITNVSCSNEVSRIVLNTTVTVLELIEPFMKVCLDCNHLTDMTKIPYREYFSLGDSVTFLTSSQSFDRAYYWKMTKYGDLATTEKPSLTMILNKTGTFTASVLVDKVVDTKSASVEFIVQEKIYGIAFFSSGFTWLRSATRFEFTAPKFDYGSCFVLNLNDSLNTKKADCSAQSTSNYTFSFNHTYLFEGNYTVCLTVFNKVSEVKRCVQVDVCKPVCKIENVSILEVNREETNIEDNSLNVLKYKRSQSFEFQGRYINHCFLPTSKDVKLLWVVKKLTSESKEPVVVGQNPGFVVRVGPRSLPYGDYQFEFTVELTSVDVTNLYGRVGGQSSIEVEIVRSPMIGNITGEKQRYLSTEDTLTLDASFHDPDLPPWKDQKGMVFTWYCRTPIGGLAEAQHFSHCYDDGLSPETFIKMLYSPIFTTTLHRYVANRTYIFTVRVTKDDLLPLTDEVRLFVLPPPPPPPPPPPTMEIRYVRKVINHFCNTCNTKVSIKRSL